MNARVGSTEIGGVIGKYGVDGAHENGQYLVDICAERGLFLLNTFFQHKMIHRYTWAMGNDRSPIDYTVDSRLSDFQLSELPVYPTLEGVRYQVRYPIFSLLFISRLHKQHK